MLAGMIQVNGDIIYAGQAHLLICYTGGMIEIKKI